MGQGGLEPPLFFRTLFTFSAPLFPPNHTILVLYKTLVKLELVLIYNVVCILHQRIIQIGFCYHCSNCIVLITS